MILFCIWKGGEDFEEVEYHDGEDPFNYEEPRSRWYDEDDDYYDAAEYVDSEVEVGSEEVTSDPEKELMEGFG